MNDPTTPKFCPGCRTPDTFKRTPDKDVKITETEVTMWHSFTCSLCGYKTLKPTFETFEEVHYEETGFGEGATEGEEETPKTV